MDELFRLFSFTPQGWGDEIASGALLTLELAAATLPFGIALGFGVALARRSKRRPVAIAGTTFATVFRGLPELLTIFIVYFGGQTVVQWVVRLVGGGQVTLSAFVSGVVALGLVFAAYASEVFIAAFRAVPRGQYDGAKALGLRRRQTFRLVILPQFVRLALPGIANLWLVLLKDTSLVSIIALDELLRETSIAVGSTKQPLPFYLAACLIYVAMSIVSSFGISAIERWSERGIKHA